MKYLFLLSVVFLVSCEAKFEVETGSSKPVVPSKENYSIHFSSQSEGNSEFRLEDKGDSGILTIQVKNKKITGAQGNGRYVYQQKLTDQVKENWKLYLDSLLSVELIDTGMNVQNGLDVSFERSDSKGKLFMAIGQVRDEDGWYFRSSQAILVKLQTAINDPVLTPYFNSLANYYNDSVQARSKVTMEELREAEKSAVKSKKGNTRAF